MSTGDFNYLLNDSRICTDPVFRFRTRKALIDKYGKTEEEVNQLIPKKKGNQYKKGVIVDSNNNETLPKKDKIRTSGNRFRTGITKTIKYQAIEVAIEDGIDSAINLIIDQTSTDVSAMNQISILKSELKEKGVDTSDIDNSKLRLEVQGRANAYMDRRVEEKLYEDDFYINPNFSYYNVINRLAIYENEDKPDSMQFIADMMIAFAARPSELYSLRFVGNKITGHLKTRGDDKPLDYAGMYSIPVAKVMLAKLPLNLDTREAKIRQKLAVFIRSYNMQPRSLRTLGAEYITRSYLPSERRKIRQLSLRHKKLSTSLLSYQMPLNVV